MESRLEAARIRQDLRQGAQLARTEEDEGVARLAVQRAEAAKKVAKKAAKKATKKKA